MTKRKSLNSVRNGNPFAQPAAFTSQKAVELSLIQNNNNNNNNASRPDIIIKNKTRENMHTDRRGNSRRQKCRAKGRGKETIIKEFMNRDATNVVPKM
jgi:competence protein ComGF